MNLTPTLDTRLEARARPDSHIIMRQTWAHLLFLHWEVPPSVLRATLPRGLHLDTYEGAAFLGVVPFFMQKVRPSPFPAVPGISNFLELNLRTYVFDDHGRPGVWFYSLDCNQALAVKFARFAFHLPYEHARMSAKMDTGMITYESQRRGDDQKQRFIYPATVCSGASEAEPGSLEFFLLERYRLFSARRDGSLHAGLVHHRPYRFERVEAETYSTRAFSLNHFAEPAGKPVSALLAQAVDITVHPLEKIA